MFSRGALGCLALKVRHGQYFSICSFTWAAMHSKKNQSHMRSSMCSRPRWPTSSWHPFRATSLCTAVKTSWKRVSSDFLDLAQSWLILVYLPFEWRVWSHPSMDAKGPSSGGWEYSMSGRQTDVIIPPGTGEYLPVSLPPFCLALPTMT